MYSVQKIEALRQIQLFVYWHKPQLLQIQADFFLHFAGLYLARIEDSVCKSA